MQAVFPTKGTCRCGKSAAGIICNDQADEDAPRCLDCLCATLGLSPEDIKIQLAQTSNLVAQTRMANRHNHIDWPPPSGPKVPKIWPSRYEPFMDS